MRIQLANISLLTSVPRIMRDSSSQFQEDQRQESLSGIGISRSVSLLLTFYQSLVRLSLRSHLPQMIQMLSLPLEMISIAISALITILSSSSKFRSKEEIRMLISRPITPVTNGSMMVVSLFALIMDKSFFLRQVENTKISSSWTPGRTHSQSGL